MLPLDTNIREAYANGQDAEQQFIQNLALFLCTFLKERGSLVERRQLSDALLKVGMVFLFYGRRVSLDMCILVSWKTIEGRNA